MSKLRRKLCNTGMIFEIKSPYDQKDGDEIFGALFVDGKRVSNPGWWDTDDYDEALNNAIHAYNFDYLDVAE